MLVASKKLVFQLDWQDLNQASVFPLICTFCKMLLSKGRTTNHSYENLAIRKTVEKNGGKH